MSTRAFELLDLLRTELDSTLQLEHDKRLRMVEQDLTLLDRAIRDLDATRLRDKLDIDELHRLRELVKLHSIPTDQLPAKSVPQFAGPPPNLRPAGTNPINSSIMPQKRRVSDSKVQAPSKRVEVIILVL